MLNIVKNINNHANNHYIKKKSNHVITLEGIITAMHLAKCAIYVTDILKFFLSLIDGDHDSGVDESTQRKVKNQPFCEL